MNWYLLDIEDTFEKLNSQPEGLSKDEAKERLAKYGTNELAEKRRKSPWLIFLNQFKDMMILILLAAALLAGWLGDLKDSIVIMVIVVLNAVVGFIQEYRAEKAMAALKEMSSSKAKVKRSNALLEVSAKELVPGDVIVVETGEKIPADLRLIETVSLRVEEASLTGESNPVEKFTNTLEEEDIPLGDRTNMAYKGTAVTFGRGTGIVVATGMETEIGSIAGMLQEEEVKTPLQERMASFGKKLSYLVLGICAVLFAIGLWRGEDTMKMLLTAVSVAVATIPETLPAVITITLALGAQKLAKKNALIRKLPAVETLGSVTYICSDKTGTLTRNKMTVREIWQEKEGEDELLSLSRQEILLFSMSANQDTNHNEEGEIKGDPTEIALVEYARKHERFQESWEKEFPRIDEIPFDTEERMMTTLHETPEGKYLLIVKGALEAILEISHVENKKEVEGASDKMAGNGMRVLAYAFKIIDKKPENLQHIIDKKDLEFCGLAGLIDPPREEAKAAVAECVDAGITSVMITGDHPITARAIAREMNIIREESDKVLTGRELSKMPPEEFEKEVEKIRVYARVNPEQKLDIVKALQHKKQFVAMTGDGVNDAPALRRANIGIAMGITGVDVSKEAAHAILLDDNFATIVKAVREGRRIYDNIRKFVRYIMTGNSGELWTILLAPLLGMPIPLLPIHILWINLVSDGMPALALAGEPAEKEIMKRPPRSPQESILGGGLGWHILWVGGLIGLACLGIQVWGMNTGNENWQTMVFTSLCFNQMAHVLAIRSERQFLFRRGIFTNMPLLGAVLLTILLQSAIIYIPFFQDIFATQPLTFKEVMICVGIAIIIFHIIELEKWIRNMIKKKS